MKIEFRSEKQTNLTYLGVGQLKIWSIRSSILIVIHFVTDQICGTIWIFSIFVFIRERKVRHFCVRRFAFVRHYCYEPRMRAHTPMKSFLLTP